MSLAEYACKDVAAILERLLPLLTDANEHAARDCSVMAKACELRDELLKFEAALIEQSKKAA